MSEYMILFVTVIAFVCGWILGSFLMLVAFHYIPKRFQNHPNKKGKNRHRYAPYYYSNKEDELCLDELDYGDIEDDEEEYDELDELDKMESGNVAANNEHNGLLERRLKKNKKSWTKFCCDFDETDELEHIKNSKKNEESAFRYTKQKKINSL